MLQRAVFGAGCFWCTEAVFNRLRGVTKVTPGYAGGITIDPDYESVSKGETGHAEVVQVDFDPTVISFAELLDVFWAIHDPTTPDRQGADIGSQYRSIILYASEDQKKGAERKREELARSGRFNNPIVTEIKPLVAFYPAEDYHRNYFERNPTRPYCQIVVGPKINKLEKKFAEKLKTA